MREIADPACTQEQVAQTYAILLVLYPDTNWLPIHRAILERWPKGVGPIQRMAENFRANDKEGC